MEFKKVRDITAEVLGADPKEIALQTSFVDDLGADSLEVFQIITAIEDEFDIEIDPADAEKIITVQDAVEEIKRVEEQ